MQFRVHSQRSLWRLGVALVLVLGHSVGLSAADLGKELRSAAKKGAVASVATLLAQGAPVDAADGDGKTPLMIAAEEGRLPVVEALLRGGANVTLRNNRDQSALDLARRKNRFNVLDSLAFASARDGNSIDAYREYLTTYKQARHADEARALLRELEARRAAEVKAEAAEAAEQSAYSAASRNDSLDSWNRYLTTYPNGRFAAEARSRVEGLEFAAAIDRGSVPLLKSVLATYPESRHVLGASEKLRVIRSSAQQQASEMDVDARDKWGGTALHKAAKEGDYALAEALIARGAKLEAEVPRTGITPLFLSATPEVAELLLAAGADLNHRDKIDNTAVDVANSAVQKFLKSKGATQKPVVYSPIASPPALRCAGGFAISFDPYDRKWLCTVDADPYLP